MFSTTLDLGLPSCSFSCIFFLGEGCDSEGLPLQVIDSGCSRQKVRVWPKPERNERQTEWLS